MNRDGMARGVRRGRFDLVERMIRAPGRRDLGSDDIGWQLAPGCQGNPLRDSRKASGAARCDLVAECNRLAGTAHGGVEVDLSESGRHIGLNQSLGLGHGLFRALLHNFVPGDRVGTRGGYLGGHEQACARPLPHNELV